jgi:hypothetical protein
MLAFRYGLAFGVLSLVCAMAQTQDTPATTVTPAAPAPGATTEVIPSPSPAQVVEDKRIFGVLPNNRTTEASIPFAPITAKRKMTIAFKDSFDLPVYPTAAAFAALYQLEDQNHSYGQGMKGYAQRFAAAYGDQMIGNMMTEGIVPVLTHQDPRYFRLGEGTKKSRAWYAVTQIFVDRTDSGHKTFNIPEWGGNALAVAIGNAYSPDTRTASDNAQKLLIACATDAFSNVLKEFWPDVKKRLHKKHDQQISSFVH